jgi:hypothetical protein
MLPGTHIFRGIRLKGVLPLGFAAAILLGSAPAMAATITVGANADTSGAQCVLRDAITAANTNAAVNGCPAGSGTDTIDVTATGQIALGSALPTITSSLAINGPGSANLDVHRSTGNYRIFNVSSGAAPASISGLTVSNGNLVGRFGTVGGGGGINNAGNLTLTDVTMSGNVASDTEAAGQSYAFGGALFNSGTLHLIGSTLTGNTATSTATGTGSSDLSLVEGGAIGNVGAMFLDRTTIHANTSSATGFFYSNAGGAVSGGGTATITASTVDANNTTATSTGAGKNALTIGGGVDQNIQQGTGNGDLTLDRVTIANNTMLSTPGPGGSNVNRGAGLAIYGGGQVNILSSTISGNSTPGFNGGNIVLNNPGGGPNVEDTIVANPGTNSNCSRENGTFTSLGHNISSDGIPIPGENCNFADATDQINTDPLLGSLADNGGLTQTMALLPGSPAIDQGTSAGATTDQRGDPRPRNITAVANSDDGADVGAFELQSTTASPISLDFGSQRVGTSGSTETATLTNEFGSNVVLGAVALTGTNAADFQIGATDTCSGATLTPGATCAVSVAFLTPGPAAVGGKTATLSIPDDTASDLVVPLSGVETNPIASPLPTALFFASQLTGTSSASQPATLTNTGTTDLHLASVDLGGTDPGQFSRDASDCLAAAHHNAVLAPAASCTVAVSFVPTSAGAKSAALSIVSDGATAPVPLSGTGTAPASATQPGATGQRAAALKKCKKKHGAKRKKCKKKAQSLPN